jgi:hypothetical protein
MSDGHTNGLAWRHFADETERDMAVFARTANGGLIVTGSAIEAHRDLILGLAARHRVPSVFHRRLEAAGGLISYGPNQLDQYAATCVDRICKGE